MDGSAEPHYLESDERKPSVWVISAKRCREASLDDQGEPKDHVVPTKELCWQMKKRPFI
jgi:hypothetical protein